MHTHPVALGWVVREKILHQRILSQERLWCTVTVQHVQDLLSEEVLTGIVSRNEILVHVEPGATYFSLCFLHPPITTSPSARRRSPLMQLLATASFAVLATLASAVHVDATAASNTTSRVLQTALGCRDVEVHVDFPGNDIGSASPFAYTDCCRKCFANQECAAYTWTSYNGGTCWFKKERTRSEFKGTNPDGSANTISAEVYRCPTLIKDFDLAGGFAIRDLLVDRASSCCQACYKEPKCTGFSWSNFNGGTCWIKGGQDLRPVAKAGVQSSLYVTGDF